MTKRLYFIAKPSYQGLILEKTIEFEYYRGESPGTIKKSVTSMHHAIKAYEGGGQILDISRHSGDAVGAQLSGKSLFYNAEDGGAYPVINVFESAKVFENGGPYRDLLHADPLTVSKDERLKSSGRLLGFNFEDKPFSLTPRHYFYDWIYVKALNQKKALHEKVITYDMVTDIDYNMSLMFASSARALAYYISLHRRSLLDHVLKDPERFEKIYKMVF